MSATIYDGDMAEYYQIQVDDNSDFSSAIWDTAKTAFASSVSEGTRTDDIVYAGSALASSTTYYWRIKFWDDDDAEGAWSTEMASFSMMDEALLTPLEIQNITYTYDTVGNITQIDDQSDTKNKKTVTFDYDDLYRLTDAYTSNSVNGGDYDRDYTYNSIGNILTKSDQGTYLYEGGQGTNYANPHAVTKIDDMNYIYDKNGNLDAEFISSDDYLMDYEWDYNNRLASVTDEDDNTTTYAYDHTGQRVIRLPHNTTTPIYYPNKYYNKQGNEETIHIYAGDALIATIETDEGNGGSSDTGFKSPTATGEDYNDFDYPANAYSSDNTYASGWALDEKQDYYNFSLNVPSGATINGIEVTVEARDIELSEGVAGIELSYDGGNPYTTTGKNTGILTNSDVVYTFGGSSDTWGRTWSDTELSNSNFRLRVNVDIVAVEIDHAQVKVYYTESGGTANSSTHFIHTDHLGGTSIITDESANITQLSDYYPYGEMRLNNGDMSGEDEKYEQRKFTGHMYDSDTDLIYMGARYYPGDRARFLSQDPVFQNMGVEQRTINLLIDPQQQNSYSYARNNPIVWIDKDGAQAQLLFNPYTVPILATAALTTTAFFNEAVRDAATVIAQESFQTISEGIQYGVNELRQVFRPQPMIEMSRPDETNLFPEGLPPDWSRWKKIGTAIGIGGPIAYGGYYEWQKKVKGNINKYNDVLNQASNQNNKNNQKTTTVIHYPQSQLQHAQSTPSFYYKSVEVEGRKTQIMFKSK